MELISSILFGLAVSADGFAAGMAYGVKKIKIPIFSLLVISLASALAVTISMLCGKGLAMSLSPELTSRLGASIILVLGCYFILQAGEDKISSIEAATDKPIISVCIKQLGNILQILNEPARADIDRSGIISAREAFFLGLALALDAMGAGIGVAMTGLNIFYTVLAVGVLKFIMVNLGLLIGAFFEQTCLKSFSAVISGLIFIIIGISEFI